MAPNAEEGKILSAKNAMTFLNGTRLIQDSIQEKTRTRGNLTEFDAEGEQKSLLQNNFISDEDQNTASETANFICVG